jgi:phage terminase large subunit-like protein
MTQTELLPQIHSPGRVKSEADLVIEWIEDWLFVPDGKDAGTKVILRDWQKAALKQIYDNDTRRAIITVGRKNGKTALAAMLLLVHLCGPMAISNTELYSSALIRDQAAILFQLAAKIVRMAPKLRHRIAIRETIKQLA